MIRDKKLSKYIVCAALAAILLLTLACGSSTDEAKLEATAVPVAAEVQDAGVEEQQNAVEEPVALQVYNVGDVVSLGDHTVMVLGWEDVPAADFYQPDEGNKFVAVEVFVVNNSASPLTVSSMLQMYLKDDTGQKYTTDVMALTSLGSTSVDGELAPGESLRGKVGYQILQNAAGLQFVFENSIFASGKIFFNLGAQPFSVEPPAELAGAIQQEMHQVGELINLGSATLVVNQATNPPGDSFNQPDAGYKFLVVDLTIQNLGSAPITVSSLLQMSVKDASSQKYTVNVMATAASGGTILDGEISPGETLRGQVGFMVPENATGLFFVFDESVWASGKVFIALQ